MKSNLELFPQAMRREVAKLPEIVVKNRYIELNDVLNDVSGSFLSRPALNKFTEVGTGPVRKVFSEPGTFNDDLFVVSGLFLYRLNRITRVATLLGQLGNSELNSVSMAVTAPVGLTPANLFIAEGGVLYLYNENSGSRSQLQAASAIGDGYYVEIGSVRYQWTSGSVNAGTPAGTAANPWLLDLKGSIVDNLAVLFNAINASGIAGTDYSTALTEHPTVSAYAYTAGDLYVAYDTPGTAGDSVPVTASGAGLSWTAATLANGGTAFLRQVPTPEDYGAISLAHINSYVIVVCIQAEDVGTNGRFYWIEPGEIEIDPLNFATAERSADKLHQVVVYSNMFWLLGEKTTEPWITTGDAAAPMERFQGILFDRGSWEGTAIQVKDSLIVIDEDGGVFQISGGQTRISTPQVEEKIRRAIQNEGRFVS